MGAGCSAAAWVVEVGCSRRHGWDYQPIAMGGIYMETRVSSFVAESMALNDAAEYVKTFQKLSSSPAANGEVDSALAQERSMPYEIEDRKKKEEETI